MRGVCVLILVSRFVLSHVLILLVTLVGCIVIILLNCKNDVLIIIIELIII